MFFNSTRINIVYDIFSYLYWLLHLHMMFRLLYTMYVEIGRTINHFIQVNILAASGLLPTY